MEHEGLNTSETRLLPTRNTALGCNTEAHTTQKCQFQLDSNSNPCITDESDGKHKINQLIHPADKHSFFQTQMYSQNRQLQNCPCQFPAVHNKFLRGFRAGKAWKTKGFSRCSQREGVVPAFCIPGPSTHRIVFSTERAAEEVQREKMSRHYSSSRTLNKATQSFYWPYMS